MAPKFIKEGKIQILAQTANSVVYAVASDSKTGWAKDCPSVLKGGTVWYEGREALGPGKDVEESDERARNEAGIYEALGQHNHILGYLGLETTVIDGVGTMPKAWAVRLERAPYAVQLAEGVAHTHRCGVVWGDLSVRNALLFDKWHIKLGDFADSDRVDDYPRDWYGCEVRYCPPGSDRPHCQDVGTMNRELFALGTAVYEIVEWKVPYGPEDEVPEDEVIAALVVGKRPQLTNDNPAEAVIHRCWGYMYESSRQIVDSLRGLL
ncbi:hypothetical protein QBC33DRAFT_553670 [Phialemonium atrogriseum]|uniref:Protein kinase domain-containing protein n=1 Tax=Phialemonium atrogriseum TaxID=1093897 RepID=A0AAJ0C921_9PEZI|nr:uncharacterized protein QBC33DRAFT_553670 [Phialemonium atrogriseum]KAK1772216.1 hypothetical protein QBC33DRAFT_553670 [Phialemonium atrogriseum]